MSNIPNRLVAGVTDNFLIHGDSSDDYPGLSVKYKNDYENIVGVRLQYELF